MLHKVAAVMPLGYLERGNRTKIASRKVASNYLDDDLSLDLEHILDEVHDLYKVSRDPLDYLLIPARAVSADRPNENLDGWSLSELVNFSPKAGMRVYATFNSKPHFVNHNAEDPAVSRGVILDSSMNELNAADDLVKEAVLQSTGKEIDKDIFTECLIGMDMTKDPSLATAYKDGSVDKFSMGCDIEQSRCSVCGNVAMTEYEFCPCIRTKMARVPYRLDDGSQRIAFEYCEGTIFTELSAVDLPADRSAKIQEGLLEIAHLTASRSYLTPEQVAEIGSFVAKNAKAIPDSLAKILNEVLSN